MTTEEYKVDRTGWPSGPWDNEPDRKEFEHAGLPCIVVRTRDGKLCGYVAVPPGHPLHGENYNDVPSIRVHGGLTYSEKCQGHVCHVPKPGESDDVWWFGFDCGHGCDLVPEREALFRDMGVKFSGLMGSGKYRDWAYVTDQVQGLAEQLANRA